MLDSGKFLIERTTAQLLEHMAQRGRAVVLEEDDQIFGYGAVWDTNEPRVLELGSFWVADEYRGNGHGREVFEKRLLLIPPKCKVVSITSSPQAAQLALQHGFRESTRDNWYTEIPYVVNCGPCDRIAVEERLRCPFMAQLRQEIGVCRQFVREF